MQEDQVMNEILQTISRIGIVPVIAIDDASKAVPLAKALAEGGLPVAEVTFRTDAAEEAMKAITAEVPDMILGAGTVLTKDQLDRASRRFQRPELSVHVFVRRSGDDVRR